MKKIIVIIIMALFVIAITFLSCSKPKQDQPINKTYTVTFTFDSTEPCYFVSIGDITNLNEFSDSIRQPKFSKTIIYDYAATYRCSITNANNKASIKKIKITYDTIVNTCDDSMYASMNCWIVVE